MNIFSENMFEKPKRNYPIAKYLPLGFGDNPIPGTVGFGMAKIGNKSIFSVDLRKKEIEEFDNIIKRLLETDKSSLVWLAGEKGIGKTALTQYYFGEENEKSMLKESPTAFYPCVLEYQDQKGIQLLKTPHKIILHSLVKLIHSQHISNKLVYTLLTGLIYRIAVLDKYKNYRNVLEEKLGVKLADVKSLIEKKGNQYIIDVLDKKENLLPENLVSFIEYLNTAGLVNFSDAFSERFLNQFILTHPQDFLICDDIKKFLLPKNGSPSDFENRIVDIINFLTLTYQKVILVIDQLDTAWEASDKAPSRKKKFTQQLASLLRRLEKTNTVIILAVNPQGKKEIESDIHKMDLDEARRLFSVSETLLVASLKTKEQLLKCLDEFFKKDKYRNDNLDSFTNIAESKAIPFETYPIDSSACEGIVEIADGSLSEALGKTKSLIDYVANKNESKESKEDLVFITNIDLQEMVKKSKSRK